MSGRNQVSPTQEEIQRRAYEIYEARGREDGNETDDWITAERELVERNSATASKTRAANAS